MFSTSAKNVVIEANACREQECRETHDRPKTGEKAQYLSAHILTLDTEEEVADLQEQRRKTDASSRALR